MELQNAATSPGIAFRCLDPEKRITGLFKAVARVFKAVSWQLKTADASAL